MNFTNPSGASGQRMRYYQDFMEQHLGIDPHTPLADCRIEAIRAAGRVNGGPFADILARAAEEARKRAVPERGRSNEFGTPSRSHHGSQRAPFARPPPSGPVGHSGLYKPTIPPKTPSTVVRPIPRFVQPESETPLNSNLLFLAKRSLRFASYYGPEDTVRNIIHEWLSVCLCEVTVPGDCLHN
jgi:hypothetical protein